MEFIAIEKNNWERKEYFDHYASHVPCTYSMTVKLDITKIQEKRLKLYPAMLYFITTIVNRHSEFRTAFNEKGELGIYSEMLPSYTVFHKESETFSNLWTEYTAKMDDFFRAYEADILRYGTQTGMDAKPNVPQNVFTVSRTFKKAITIFFPSLQWGNTIRKAEKHCYPSLYRYITLSAMDFTPVALSMNCKSLSINVIDATGKRITNKSIKRFEKCLICEQDRIIRKEASEA